jgi:hyperosmotically inducible periplasmic protein
MGAVFAAVSMLSVPMAAPANPLNGAQSRQAPNASDQANDKESVKLAAEIRRALVKDKGLSVWAHNVTVVVNGGVVTLRGPVKSSEEKRAVRQKAQSVAGTVPVKDMLTVKQ